MQGRWQLARRAVARARDPDPAFAPASLGELPAAVPSDVTELRRGLSLVTGDTGRGRAVRAEALRQTLAETSHGAFAIGCPELSPTQLLYTFAAGLELQRAPRGKSATVARLDAGPRELEPRRPPLPGLADATLATAGLLEEIGLPTELEERTNERGDGRP